MQERGREPFEVQWLGEERKDLLAALDLNETSRMMYKLNRRACAPPLSLSIKEMSVNRTLPGRLVRAGSVLSLSLLAFAYVDVTTSAQDRLKTMPGYAQFQKVSAQLNGVMRSGAINGTWSADSSSVEYVLDGKRYRFDVATRHAADLGPVADANGAAGRGGRGGGRGGTGIERGRQAASADSPDGKLKAFYRDRNLWVSDAAGANASAITTDGNDKDRIKYGTASWVYGEELAQTSAMWWSPDSRKVAYYRFDEKQVPDYYLQLDQTKIQSTNDVEAYPKAGAANPIVDLFVYDVATKKSTKVDVRDGKPFDNSVVGHYVYRVSWSPDGRELLFNRTNRRQNVLEFVAANPDTGATRVIVREEWPTGWVDNRPPMQFLKDNRRFIWESERNGCANFYLYDLTGKLITPLTAHSAFEVTGIVKVDEAAGVLFYTARDGDNHLKLQLHRVGLDGKGDVRLTDPAFHHTVGACGGGAPAGAADAAASAARPRAASRPTTSTSRHVSDARHPAGDAPRRCDREGRGRARQERPDEVRRARSEEGRDVHLQGRRRQDDAARADSVPVELRSGEEVSGARAGLRRPGVGRQHGPRDVRDAERARRVRLPRRQPRLARRPGHGQAHARLDLPEARPGRDRRHGRGREGAVAAGRTSTRRASGSTARRTAAMRR